MINILNAKQVYYIDACDSAYSPKSTDLDLELCVLAEGTERQINLDYFRQGESYGQDNEVYHNKYEATLVGDTVDVETQRRVTFEGSYNWNFDKRVIEFSSSHNSSFTMANYYRHDHKYEKLRGKIAWEKTGTLVDGKWYVHYTSYRYDDRSGDLLFTRETDEVQTYAKRRVICTKPITDNDIHSIKTQLSLRPKVEDLPQPSSEIWSALYAECCNAVFPLDSNNIANAKDIASTFSKILKAIKAFTSKGKSVAKYFDVTNIRSFLEKNVVPTSLMKDHVDPKKAADAWLAYRYAYTTTKMDIKEHVAHLGSAWDIYQNWSNDNLFVTHATGYISNDTVAHMTLRLQPHMRTAMQELWVKSAALGLQINAVNIWDLIPYSFVVDWFLPIEEQLQALDNTCLFNETHFTISLPIVSTKQTVDIETSFGTIRETRYARWQLASRPVFCAAESTDPSSRTKLYRAADGVSLIVGAL